MDFLPWLIVNLIWGWFFGWTVRSKNKIIDRLRVELKGATEDRIAAIRTAENALTTLHNLTIENDNLREALEDVESVTTNGAQTTKNNYVPATPFGLPSTTSRRKIKF